MFSTETFPSPNSYCLLVGGDFLFLMWTSTIIIEAAAHSSPQSMSKICFYYSKIIFEMTMYTAKIPIILKGWKKID